MGTQSTWGVIIFLQIMRCLISLTIVLSLVEITFQQGYGSAPRAVPEPVCRQVPKEVCNQVPRTIYESVSRKQCRDVPDTVCADVQERKCQISQRPVQETVSRKQCRLEYKKDCKT